MAQRRLRVRALEQQGARVGTGSYKQNQGFALAKMELALVVESRGTIELELTYVGSWQWCPPPLGCEEK